MHMKILFNQRQNEVPELAPVQVDPRIFEDTDESGDDKLFYETPSIHPVVSDISPSDDVKIGMKVSFKHKGKYYDGVIKEFRANKVIVKNKNKKYGVPIKKIIIDL